jgi:Tfp pilus assembly protein PilZ
MERRRGDRWRRRLAVRFWHFGEDRPRLGHTLNLSPGGLYVGTDRPPRSGSRVRVEVLDPEQGFVVEGMVTHSHRIARELQQIRSSGMGVRFLRHDELVGAFCPPQAPEAAEAPAAPEAGGRPPAAAASPPVAAPPPAQPEASAGPPAGKRGWLNLAPGGVVPVRFATVGEFQRIFERDILHGGLFVACERPPARLQEVVSLKLSLPDGRGTVVVPSRVVHRRDAADASGPAGMGVEFLDPESVVSQLRNLVEGLSAAG